MVKPESLEDAGELPDNLFAAEAHLFVVVNVRALVSARFGNGIPEDLFQVTAAGITKPGVEVTGNYVGASDQVFKI